MSCFGARSARAARAAALPHVLDRHQGTRQQTSFAVRVTFWRPFCARRARAATLSARASLAPRNEARHELCCVRGGQPLLCMELVSGSALSPQASPVWRAASAGYWMQTATEPICLRARLRRWCVHLAAMWHGLAPLSRATCRQSGLQTAMRGAAPGALGCWPTRPARQLPPPRNRWLSCCRRGRPRRRAASAAVAAAKGNSQRQHVGLHLAHSRASWTPAPLLALRQLLWTQPPNECLLVQPQLNGQQRIQHARRQLAPALLGADPRRKPRQPRRQALSRKRRQAGEAGAAAGRACW